MSDLEGFVRHLGNVQQATEVIEGNYGFAESSYADLGNVADLVFAVRAEDVVDLVKRHNRLHSNISRVLNKKESRL